MEGMKNGHDRSEMAEVARLLRVNNELLVAQIDQLVMVQTYLGSILLITVACFGEGWRFATGSEGPDFEGRFDDREEEP